MHVHIMKLGSQVLFSYLILHKLISIHAREKQHHMKHRGTTLSEGSGSAVPQNRARSVA